MVRSLGAHWRIPGSLARLDLHPAGNEYAALTSLHHCQPPLDAFSRSHWTHHRWVYFHSLVDFSDWNSFSVHMTPNSGSFFQYPSILFKLLSRSLHRRIIIDDHLIQLYIGLDIAYQATLLSSRILSLLVFWLGVDKKEYWQEERARNSGRSNTTPPN